jgi:hypothetical protein
MLSSCAMTIEVGGQLLGRSAVVEWIPCGHDRMDESNGNGQMPDGMMIT